VAEEFDRDAAAVAELERLTPDPGMVLQAAEVRWTATGVEGDGGWEKLADMLAQGVLDIYKNGEVDPRSPESGAGEVAGAIVSTPNDLVLGQWFGVLDDVWTLRMSADGDAGDDTFTAAPGVKLRDVIAGGVETVLSVAAARLIAYVEDVVDAKESAWDDARSGHDDGDDEPGSAD
jgi:hypothetical protein